MPIGVLFLFGSVMAACAALTLLFPATVLDALWALNPKGHQGLSNLGQLAALLFCVMSPVLGLAAFGWFRRRRWGWGLGFLIIFINMAGDIIQLRSGEWKGAIGVAIAGSLLVYLSRDSVENYFGPKAKSS